MTTGHGNNHKLFKAHWLRKGNCINLTSLSEGSEVMVRLCAATRQHTDVRALDPSSNVTQEWAQELLYDFLNKLAPHQECALTSCSMIA